MHPYDVPSTDITTCSCMLESHLDGLSAVENSDFDHLKSGFGFRCLIIASPFGEHGYSPL